MSELRFRRALKARSPEEFFLAARRMLTLAGGVADITVLADDLLAWAFEHHGRDVSQPARSLSFRWAQDYYQPLRGKDADLAAEGTPAEGEVA